jgi:hypothetical protein
MRAAMQHLLNALAVIALLALPASADEAADKKKADAQKQIDEGKVKGCNALRDILMKNKQCPEEAAEVEKITCSKDAYEPVAKLQLACAERIKRAAEAKADKAARPAAGSKKFSCKALDDAGAVIAEASTAKLSDCRKEIKAAVEKAKCDGKTKKVKYKFQRDATKPTSSTVFCKKP